MWPWVSPSSYLQLSSLILLICTISLYHLVSWCSFSDLYSSLFPPNMRSDEDKVEMIFLYGQAHRNIHETERLFNDAHPDRPVCRKYIRELVTKFTTTCSVKDAPRGGRPKVRNEEVDTLVLAEFCANPHQSVRLVAREREFSLGTVHAILKAHKFHPYKIKLVHEMNDDDPDRRLQFCEELLDQMRENLDYIKRICFSDEASFNLHGTVNRHNCRYWSNSNPHWFREAHTQHPQKINVWAGIFHNQIIGPFFFEENLTGEAYLHMLTHQIYPAIEASNVAQANDFQPIFQQDGAPPHFHRQVRASLDRQFPGRWIGRRGVIEWPARSPDMTPMDFFLWGYIKERVYETRPVNLADLQQRIVNVCAAITPEVFDNVRRHFESRLYFCQEVNGEHFEHLIA